MASLGWGRGRVGDGLFLFFFPRKTMTVVVLRRQFCWYTNVLFYLLRIFPWKQIFVTTLKWYDKEQWSALSWIRSLAKMHPLICDVLVIACNPNEILLDGDAYQMGISKPFSSQYLVVIGAVVEKLHFSGIRYHIGRFSWQQGTGLHYLYLL